jgi:hypothetical protein
MKFQELLKKSEITWEQIISGFMEKMDKNFSTKNNLIYDILTSLVKLGG